MIFVFFVFLLGVKGVFNPDQSPCDWSQ